MFNLKRLVTKNNEQFTYVATSTPKVNVRQSESDDYWSQTLSQDDVIDLERALEDEVGESGQLGLAEYLDGPLADVVTSITLKVVNLKIQTTVKTTRELTVDELEDLKNYVIGQFADGFGEGFEQSPFRVERGVYEDEDEDGNVEELDTDDEYFCSLYTDSTESELNFKQSS